jgi:hypothetical protein
MENEVLQEIAKARGKTVAQVLFNISSNWKDCKHVPSFQCFGRKRIIYIYIYTDTHILEKIMTLFQFIVLYKK